MFVDYQTHWYPPGFLKSLLGRSTHPLVESVDGKYVLELAPGARTPIHSAVIDLEEQLSNADHHGVDVLVSSPNQLGQVLHLDPSEAADMMLRLNEAVADSQLSHSDRFVGLAMLPMQDPGQALLVLEDAVRHGLRGVCMLSSIDGGPIATDATLPVFMRIEELRLPLFLHPAVRSNTSREGGFTPRLEGGLGRMYHSTLAALTLIESGTLDACPGLVVVHPHLGGVFPYVVGRIQGLPSAIERPIQEYLKQNFYIDTMGATPGALRLAIDTYGLDHVLFGSDYPYSPVQVALDYLENNLSESDRLSIRSNALPGLRLPT